MNKNMMKLQKAHVTTRTERNDTCMHNEFLRIHDAYLLYEGELNSCQI
jgi:hypothetical protein